MPERLVRTSPIPLVSMQDNAGEFHKFGWVMLNGKRETFRDAHTVSSTLADGYSVVGGWSVVQLENGLTLRIEVDAVDGVVTSTPLNNGGRDHPQLELRSCRSRAGTDRPGYVIST